MLAPHTCEVCALGPLLTFGQELLTCGNDLGDCEAGVAMSRHGELAMFLVFAASRGQVVSVSEMLHVHLPHSNSRFNVVCVVEAANAVTVPMVDPLLESYRLFSAASNPGVWR